MTTLFSHNLEPDPEVHVAAVRLFNYKAAGDLRLELGKRLHVIIGDNGAGKTTVLDGIAAGLAKVSEKVGIKATGGERVKLSFNRIRRRNGEYAAQAGIVLRLGAGTIVDEEEVHSRAHSVFVTDPFERPTIPDGDAADWFSTRLREARGTSTDSLPLFVYYTTDRAAIPPAPKPKDAATKRSLALHGAFRAEASYQDLVAWFSTAERAELYEMRRRGDVGFRDPVLEAVRNAVRQLVGEVEDLAFDPLTGHLQVETQTNGGRDHFALDELSGGGRVMVALAADLARRMIQANPHLGLNTPAIVLIDELDLHLHPKWQARVVDDLMSTFPHAQFIVSTHSEQIIAAVPTELVRAVRFEPGGVKAYRLPAIEGATYDRVLEDGMGLERRRPKAYQDLMDEYRTLVDAGSGESVRALELRAQLDEIYQGNEPELVRLDLVIRRLKARGERR